MILKRRRNLSNSIKSQCLPPFSQAAHSPLSTAPPPNPIAQPALPSPLERNGRERGGVTICLVSLRLICLRYLIEMHSTKVLVCKQACSMPTVQPASYIAPGKGGTRQRVGRGPERTRTRWRDEGKPGERIKKLLLFNIQKQFAKFNQSRGKANIFTTLTFLLALS